MKKKIIIIVAAFAMFCLTVVAATANRSKTKDSSTITPVASTELSYTPMVMETFETKTTTKFVYDVGPRFRAIKKQTLDQATSFSDFIGEAHSQRIVSYKSLSVIILDGSKKTDIQETSSSGQFTQAQINLLQSSTYSTNVLIWADYREKNQSTGIIEDNYWTPHLTVVPETQAQYSLGKEALIQFLEEQSKDYRAQLLSKNLLPAKMCFTITKEGRITNIKQEQSSGYPELDAFMGELLIKAPGNWEAATNLKGDKVAQELVISFGVEGC